jgi:hypothetical protein
VIAPSFFETVRQANPVVKLKRAIAFGAVCVVSVSVIGLYRHSHRTLVWRPGELPVAFWAWQSRAPEQSDVEAAINRTGASTLFLRAGQIDLEAGRPRRIRAVTGSMPKNIKLHLVYNATRDFLSRFEKLNPDEVAEAVATAYAFDAQRALADGANVNGAQLDFDVPTRLLGEYGTLLALIRKRLPAETRLSITGLPAWMASPSLNDTLSHVDFWIPQCYGASVPDRLERREPIASPKVVANAVARARELGRPFYAGLAAYGYAIHYSRDGSLLALRGDLDPEVIARAGGLELVEGQPFGGAVREKSAEVPSGEWRYVYRARGDCVIDGTPVRTGEWVVLEVPTSESLRACARVARDQGGDKLLGLCVFRLPTADDRPTLSTQEVTCALADVDPVFSFKIHASATPRAHNVLLTVENDGSAGSTAGESAMTLWLKVPSGTVRAVNVGDFSSYEAIADAAGARAIGEGARLGVCSLRRADTLRLATNWWRPGSRASAEIEFVGEPPVSIRVECSSTNENRREFREVRTVQIRRRGEQ